MEAELHDITPSSMKKLGGAEKTEEDWMQKTLGMLLLMVGAAVCCTAAVPEIDPATGGSAIALVAGALLVIRGRKK